MVLISVPSAIEIDHLQELLDTGQLLHLEQSLRDIVEDLDTGPRLPARSELDKDLAVRRFAPDTETGRELPA